ncbi:hypothetical protein AB0C27_55850 [Nonomuraea sp. NPDC048882]|uniref:hypothetical protein n=1 Tax=Nonomuraea sp. NPDC048882 TaxID=3154347 RepID=UPI0033C7D8CE
MSDGESGSGGGPIAVLWAELLAEFDRYGGLNHTEISTWSSHNDEVETLKANTVRDWMNPERTTAPKRPQFVTILKYLDFLRLQAGQGGGDEPTGPHEQDRQKWWDLYRPAWSERLARRQSGSGAEADERREEENEEQEIHALEPAVITEVADSARAKHEGHGLPEVGAAERSDRGPLDNGESNSAAMPMPASPEKPPRRQLPGIDPRGQRHRRRVVLRRVAVLAGVAVILTAAFLLGRLSMADANNPGALHAASDVPSPRSTHNPEVRRPGATQSPVPAPTLSESPSSTPSNPPVFCARVIVDQAGLYHSSGDISSWYRWKTRGALITMSSTAPLDGWLKVRTPKDPAGAHAWMRAPELSSPKLCGSGNCPSSCP